MSDAAIEACDTQRTALDREAAEVAAEWAAERAAAEAAEAAQRTTYRNACQSRGGHVSGGGTCLVDYPGWSAQIVAVRADGSFDTAQAEMNRQDCDTATADAALSAQDGFPWSQLPEYHSDTGVCVLGSI